MLEKAKAQQSEAQKVRLSRACISPWPGQRTVEDSRVRMNHSYRRLLNSQAEMEAKFNFDMLKQKLEDAIAVRGGVSD